MTQSQQNGQSSPTTEPNGAKPRRKKRANISAGETERELMHHWYGERDFYTQSPTEKNRSGPRTFVTVGIDLRSDDRSD